MDAEEEEIADLDFGVYHGHDSHGSRSIIMITGFLMASLVEKTGD